MAWIARTLVLVAGIGHALALPAVAALGVDVPWLWLWLPALVTVALVRGAWRRSWRWVVLWALVVYAVYPDSMVVVLGAGQTWLLWRSWITEADERPGLWWLRRGATA